MNMTHMFGIVGKATREHYYFDINKNNERKYEKGWKNHDDTPIDVIAFKKKQMHSGW